MTTPRRRSDDDQDPDRYKTRERSRPSALKSTARPQNLSAGGLLALWPVHRSPPSICLADYGDCPLIDAGRVPGLDRREIGLARLISRAGAPAMRVQEIRRRHQALRSALSRLPPTP